MLKGNDALKALWDALNEGRESPPANSITAQDYAAQSGLSRSHAKARLTAMAKAGKFEVGTFNVKGHLIKFYWLPKGKKK